MTSSAAGSRSAPAPAKVSADSSAPGADRLVRWQATEAVDGPGRPRGAGASRPGKPRTRTRRCSDEEGILWFTLQQSNMVGRLDPATGDIKLGDCEEPEGTRPYGIKIDANGVPWFACNGSNCLVKVDPEDNGTHRGRAARVRRRPSGASTSPGTG